MTTSNPIESSTAHDQANDDWLQVTPGERLRIRISSAQTMGAYSAIEVVAWDTAAGSSAIVKRGEPHAWCNSSDTPLRMLVVFSPGHIEGLFRAAAAVDDVDEIAAIAGRYGTQLIGPPLQERVHSIYSPRKYSGL